MFEIVSSTTQHLKRNETNLDDNHKNFIKCSGHYSYANFVTQEFYFHSYPIRICHTAAESVTYLLHSFQHPSQPSNQQPHQQSIQHAMQQPIQHAIQHPTQIRLNIHLHIIPNFIKRNR